MFSKIFGATLTVIVLLICENVLAQSYAESALQFSRTSMGGSARVLGFGGAQTAIGGDYSSGLSNPAGLGMFNHSEFSFSPGFTSQNVKASYLGNTDNDSKSSLNIPGLSLVVNIPPKNNSSFFGGSFGITMTRINDFNQSFQYHGLNNDTTRSTSIIDSFIGLANGDNKSQFDQNNYNYNTPTGLAYYNYLIGPKALSGGSETDYFSDVKANSYPTQHEDVQTKGSSYQWSFSYGANFKDKIFIGGGLGITTLNFKSAKIYSESFTGDPYLNSLQLEEDLTVKGSGINATLGIIGRPLNFLQLGASFTTPTFYQLTENYSASMDTNWKNFDYYGDQSTILNKESAQTDIVTSDYTLTTPLKLSLGAVLKSKIGFISGDIDFVNVANAKYSATTSGLSFTGDNQDIKYFYKPAINYRLGAEYRYNIFRARAGYGVQANTYKSGFDVDNTITTISGGIGFKMDKVAVDFALVNSNGKNLYSPYNNAPTVELKNNMMRGVITVSFTF